MTLRTSMTELIAQVRSRIGDPAGADQVFTDLYIQDVLDRRRRDVFQVELTAMYTLNAAGTAETLNFFADGGGWETDVLLQDPDYAALTDASTPIALASSDCNVGKWVTDAHQDAPVRLTGRQYDLNGAAADLLDEWVSKVALEFDFLSGGRTFKRSQQVAGLEAASSKFRARQWLGYSVMTRLDMNG